MSKFWKIAIALAMSAVLVPFVTTSANAAATVKVTGKIPAGYKVLLVARTGQTTSSNGPKFTLNVAAAQLKSGTLHLVTSSGSYAGPIVLKFDAKKKSGLVQLSGKAGDIGTVAFKGSYGIAKQKKPSKAIATNAASKITVDAAGKPAGAGKMGMDKVVSKSGVVAAAARATGVRAFDSGSEPAGSDTDKDGLPSSIDLDDDGDAKIDLVDDSNPSKALTTGSLLFLDLSKTINKNIGLTDAEMKTAIDGVLKSNNNFWIGIGLPAPGDASKIDGAHVTCEAAVAWCASNTPATLFGSNLEKWADKKSDGFALSLPSGSGPNSDASTPSNPAGPANGGGTPQGPPNPPTPGGASKSSAKPTDGSSGGLGFNRQFIPQLESDKVTPGSLFNINFSKGGQIVYTQAGALSPYFTAVPALKSVTVGSRVVEIDYKNKNSTFGTSQNPVVIDGSASYIKLTYWRPQRSGVKDAGEASFVDMGGLRYGFYIGVAKPCGAAAYSELSSNLSVKEQAGFDHTPLVDSAGDAEPNAANTMSFVIDISKCSGAGPTGGSVPSIGNTAQMVTLISSSPADGGTKAYQDFYLKRG
jgi:hypothetical protein